MTRECYRTVAGPINRSPGLVSGGLIALAFIVLTRASALGQHAPPSPETSVIARVTAHLRAFPHASGPVTLVRHEHAYARTTTERGTLVLGPSGAHLTLDHAEIAITPALIEAFDEGTSPARVLVQRGETVLARYAAMIAGDDPALLFTERVIARAGSVARVELVPRTAWIGLERVVLRVVDEGRDQARIERALWLDGLGNWQRLDLERLTHPAQIDPRALLLSPHPGARRIEI